MFRPTVLNFNRGIIKNDFSQREELETKEGFNFKTDDQTNDFVVVQTQPDSPGSIAQAVNQNTSKDECYEMDDQKVQKGYSETIRSDSEVQSKSGKKEPKTKDLDKRRDVLNKTLLRSLKKHLTHKFYQFSGLLDIEYAERQERFEDLMKQFVAEYYGEKVS